MSGVRDDVSQVVDLLTASMVDSWHARDSDGFAEHFHPDTVFVDVLGRVFRGRAKVAEVHRRNFATIHAGSRLELGRRSSELLADGVALVHVGSAIWVPEGPLAGDSRATQTWILTKTTGGWLIKAFHNTFVREMAGVPAA